LKHSVNSIQLIVGNPNSAQMDSQTQEQEVIENKEVAVEAAKPEKVIHDVTYNMDMSSIDMEKLPTELQHKCWSCKDTKTFIIRKWRSSHNKTTGMAQGNCSDCGKGISRIHSMKPYFRAETSADANRQEKQEDKLEGKQEQEEITAELA
jgi:hypothetical protein